MGISHVWDTKQQFPQEAEKFMDDLVKKEQPVISVITEIEMLCWKAATEKDIKVLHNFIDDALIIELEQSVKLKTADIRKEKKLKLPDAIIAATALAFDLTLVSRNVPDFRNIDGLKVINPWEL